VDPPVEGETLRLGSPLEGAGKPFRVVELVALEALFRLVSGAVEDTATRPISKRRLLLLWQSAEGMDAPPLTERDLALTKASTTVTFDEFIFIIRLKLLGGSRSFAKVEAAFEIVSNMIRLERGQPAVRRGGPPSTTKGELSPLVHATLRVYMGACSTAEAHLAADDAENLLMAMSEMAGDESSDVETSLSSLSRQPSAADLSPRRTNRMRSVSQAAQKQPQANAGHAMLKRYGVHVDSKNGEVSATDVVKQVTALAARYARPANLADDHHGVIEAIEYALLYGKQEGLGMYSPQLETMHPRYCDACKGTPIIGYRFACAECEDFDLCAQCFHHGRGSHPETHGFVRYPGGLSVNPLGEGASVAGGFSARRTRGRSGASRTAPSPIPDVEL
jgi:hypothetical protein